MKNQFFYTRKVNVAKEGEEAKFTYFSDSFNINRVLRSHHTPNNHLIILLDDYHDKKQDVPVMNKQGRQTGWKKETISYQTEIILTEENDIERFKELTGITE